MQKQRYEFWQEWCAEQGQFYAEPHHFDSAIDAKRSHSAALEFLWASGKARPSVSDLFVVTYTKEDERSPGRLVSRVKIQDGAARDVPDALPTTL